MENIHDLSKWVKEELESIEVDVLDFRTMEKVVQGGNPFVIMFVDDHKKELNSEKAVLKMADKYGIGVAKVDGLAPKYGINIVPTFVYFEDGLPSIFDEEGEELDNDPEGMEYRKKGLYIFTNFFSLYVLLHIIYFWFWFSSGLSEWIEEQRTSSTIEEVTEELLKLLASTREYVAVFFTGPCNENAATDQECERVLNDLENIDDELDDFGIKLVTTEDIKYAGKVLKINRIPSLGIFRNGQFKLYEGPLDDESELLSWLIDKDTLELPGMIEKVNEVMLDRIVSESDNVAVLFYDPEQKIWDIIKALELVDDKLDKIEVPFVKFPYPNIAKREWDISEFPKLM